MEEEDQRFVFDLTYYPVVICTILLVMLMYKTLMPQLSSKLFTYHYTSLSEADRCEWNMRFLSNFHAITVSAICIYTLLFDYEVYNNPIWSDRPIIRLNCALLTGFVIADSLILLLEGEQDAEAFAYYCHHGAAAFAYYYVFTYGVLSYFANFRIMAEFSTPFVNLRWFLDKTNFDKTSTLFVINGCLMTLTFISARVLSMPKFWYTIYTYLGSQDFELLGTTVTVMIGTCLVLDILNIKWSIRMLRGAHKVVLATLDKNRNIVHQEQKKEL